MSRVGVELISLLRCDQEDRLLLGREEERYSGAGGFRVGGAFFLSFGVEEIEMGSSAQLRSFAPLLPFLSSFRVPSP